MKRAKWPRIVLATLGVWVALLPQAVSAHPVVEQGWPPGNRSGIIAGIQGFCVHAGVTQEHTWHSISTFATNCNNIRNAWHIQYQSYFKQDQWGNSAQHCFNEGWHQSPNAQQHFTRHYGWDIWWWCNYGAGTHVTLYVDSWQYSWHDVQGWIGGAWRPATRHCHCP